jgi:hypothetical protein
MMRSPRIARLAGRLAGLLRVRAGFARRVRATPASAAAAAPRAPIGIGSRRMLGAQRLPRLDAGRIVAEHIEPGHRVGEARAVGQ